MHFTYCLRGTYFTALVATLPLFALADTTSTDVGAIILQGLGSYAANNYTATATKNSTISASSTPSETLLTVPASITGAVSSTLLTASSQDTTDGLLWSTNDGVSGLPSAQQCFSSILDWRSQSINWYNANIANRTWPITATTTTTSEIWEASTTVYPTDPSTYTLCDHSPRVNVDPITEHSSWITTLFLTQEAVATPTYSIPQPCYPNNKMCRLWYYESTLFNISNHEVLEQCGFPAHMDLVKK
jgi:hypothetical protein